MATVYFTGGADEVAKVMTATPANPNTDDVYNLLVGGKTIATFTVAAAETVQAVVEGLQASWAANYLASPSAC